MKTIYPSTRFGKLVLTCSACKAEKVFQAMVSPKAQEPFIKEMQEKHSGCAEVKEEIK